MSEYQRTLYGATLLPVEKMTVKERCEAAVAVLGDSLDPELRRLYSWMMDPHVNAFIRTIPSITTVDEAREEYLQHLQSKNGCFESEARATRMAAADSKSGSVKITKKRSDQLKKKNDPPEWYKRYLKTRHWLEPVIGVRAGALMYYGSCVLCGVTRDLQVHHKHYNTLGKEDSHDVSILCDSHHKQITPLVGIYVPKIMPPSVVELFRKEGIDMSEFLTTKGTV